MALFFDNEECIAWQQIPLKAMSQYLKEKHSYHIWVSLSVDNNTLEEVLLGAREKSKLNSPALTNETIDPDARGAHSAPASPLSLTAGPSRGNRGRHPLTPACSDSFLGSKEAQKLKQHQAKPFGHLKPRLHLVLSIHTFGKPQAAEVALVAPPTDQAMPFEGAVEVSQAEMLSNLESQSKTLSNPGFSLELQELGSPGIGEGGEARGATAQESFAVAAGSLGSTSEQAMPFEGAVGLSHSDMLNDMEQNPPTFAQRGASLPGQEAGNAAVLIEVAAAAATSAAAIAAYKTEPANDILPTEGEPEVPQEVAAADTALKDRAAAKEDGEAGDHATRVAPGTNACDAPETPTAVPGAELPEADVHQRAGAEQQPLPTGNDQPDVDDEPADAAQCGAQVREAESSPRPTLGSAGPGSLVADGPTSDTAPDPSTTRHTDALNDAGAASTTPDQTDACDDLSRDQHTVATEVCSQSEEASGAEPLKAHDESSSKRSLVHVTGAEGVGQSTTDKVPQESPSSAAPDTAAPDSAPTCHAQSPWAGLRESPGMQCFAGVVAGERIPLLWTLSGVIQDIGFDGEGVIKGDAAGGTHVETSVAGAPDASDCTPAEQQHQEATVKSGADCAKGAPAPADTTEAPDTVGARSSADPGGEVDSGTTMQNPDSVKNDRAEAQLVDTIRHEDEEAAGGRLLEPRSNFAAEAIKQSPEWQCVVDVIAEDEKQHLPSLLFMLRDVECVSQFASRNNQSEPWGTSSGAVDAAAPQDATPAAQVGKETARSMADGKAAGHSLKTEENDIAVTGADKAACASVTEDPAKGTGSPAASSASSQARVVNDGSRCAAAIPVNDSGGSEVQRDIGQAGYEQREQDPGLDGGQIERDGGHTREVAKAVAVVGIEPEHVPDNQFPACLLQEEEERQRVASGERDNWTQLQQVGEQLEQMRRVHEDAQCDLLLEEWGSRMKLWAQEACDRINFQLGLVVHREQEERDERRLESEQEWAAGIAAVHSQELERLLRGQVVQQQESERLALDVDHLQMLEMHQRSGFSCAEAMEQGALALLEAEQQELRGRDSCLQTEKQSCVELFGQIRRELMKLQGDLMKSQSEDLEPLQRTEIEREEVEGRLALSATSLQLRETPQRVVISTEEFGQRCALGLLEAEQQATQGQASCMQAEQHDWADLVGKAGQNTLEVVEMTQRSYVELLEVDARFTQDAVLELFEEKDHHWGDIQSAEQTSRMKQEMVAEQCRERTLRRQIEEAERWLRCDLAVFLQQGAGHLTIIEDECTEWRTIVSTSSQQRSHIQTIERERVVGALVDAQHDMMLEEWGGRMTIWGDEARLWFGFRMGLEDCCEHEQRTSIVQMEKQSCIGLFVEFQSERLEPLQRIEVEQEQGAERFALNAVSLQLRETPQRVVISTEEFGQRCALGLLEAEQHATQRQASCMQAEQHDWADLVEKAGQNTLEVVEMTQRSYVELLEVDARFTQDAVLELFEEEDHHWGDIQSAEQKQKIQVLWMQGVQEAVVAEQRRERSARDEIMENQRDQWTALCGEESLSRHQIAAQVLAALHRTEPEHRTLLELEESQATEALAVWSTAGRVGVLLQDEGEERAQLCAAQQRSRWAFGALQLEEAERLHRQALDKVEVLRRDHAERHEQVLRAGLHCEAAEMQCQREWEAALAMSIRFIALEEVRLRALCAEAQAGDWLRLQDAAAAEVQALLVLVTEAEARRRLCGQEVVEHGAVHREFLDREEAVARRRTAHLEALHRGHLVLDLQVLDAQYQCEQALRDCQRETAHAARLALRALETEEAQQRQVGVREEREGRMSIALVELCGLEGRCRSRWAREQQEAWAALRKAICISDEAAERCGMEAMAAALAEHWGMFGHCLSVVVVLDTEQRQAWAQLEELAVEERAARRVAERSTPPGYGAQAAAHAPPDAQPPFHSVWQSHLQPPPVAVASRVMQQPEVEEEVVQARPLEGEGAGGSRAGQSTGADRAAHEGSAQPQPQLQDKAAEDRRLLCDVEADVRRRVADGAGWAWHGLQREFYQAYEGVHRTSLEQQEGAVRSLTRQLTLMHRALLGGEALSRWALQCSEAKGALVCAEGVARAELLQGARGAWLAITQAAAQAAALQSLRETEARRRTEREREVSQWYLTALVVDQAMTMRQAVLHDEAQEWGWLWQEWDWLQREVYMALRPRPQPRAHRAPADAPHWDAATQYSLKAGGGASEDDTGPAAPEASGAPPIATAWADLDFELQLELDADTPDHALEACRPLRAGAPPTVQDAPSAGPLNAPSVAETEADAARGLRPVAPSPPPVPSPGTALRTACACAGRDSQQFDLQRTQLLCDERAARLTCLWEEQDTRPQLPDGLWGHMARPLRVATPGPRAPTRAQDRVPPASAPPAPPKSYGAVDAAWEHAQAQALLAEAEAEHAAHAPTAAAPRPWPAHQDSAGSGRWTPTPPPADVDGASGGGLVARLNSDLRNARVPSPSARGSGHLRVKGARLRGLPPDAAFSEGYAPFNSIDTNGLSETRSSGSVSPDNELASPPPTGNSGDDSGPNPSKPQGSGGAPPPRTAEAVFRSASAEPSMGSMLEHCLVEEGILRLEMLTGEAAARRALAALLPPPPAPHRGAVQAWGSPRTPSGPSGAPPQPTPPAAAVPYRPARPGTAYGPVGHASEGGHAKYAASPAWRLDANKGGGAVADNARPVHREEAAGVFASQPLGL